MIIVVTRARIFDAAATPTWHLVTGRGAGVASYTFAYVHIIRVHNIMAVCITKEKPPAAAAAAGAPVCEAGDF